MGIRLEPFTANQALNLLWVHYCDPSTDIDLRDEEIAHLKLEVICDWDNLTTHYKKQLVTLDKLALIRIMADKDDIFGVLN